jgi:hypothetical protein
MCREGKQLIATLKRGSIPTRFLEVEVKKFLTAARCADNGTS